MLEDSSAQQQIPSVPTDDMGQICSAPESGRECTHLPAPAPAPDAADDVQAQRRNNGSEPETAEAVSKQQCPAQPAVQHMPATAAIPTAASAFSLRLKEGPLPASPLDEPRWSHVTAWVETVVGDTARRAAASRGQPAAHVSVSAGTNAAT